MEIKPGKFVEAIYDLYVGEEDGARELMEKATPEEPLKFVFGIGQMLESFEEKIAGLKPGDKFDFIIPADAAYGEYDDEHILDLPKEMFEVDGVFDSEMIIADNVVPMMDANGNRLNGTVVEVKDDIVVMDFNHPLAGENLHFIGEVKTVRDATPEELTPVSGGCGCGCSSEGCDSDCNCDSKDSKEGGCGSNCNCG